MNDLQAPRGRWAGWGPLIGLVLFVAGLYVTFQVTAGLIYAADGYQPGAADCDDCGITLLLDNIGWIGLALGAYLAVVALVSYLVLRRPGAVDESSP